ncbi:acyl dehydratase [Aliidiomarina minuta]|uniref:Acyl dehydratase n=1 Tax=Aliidiomarina minuta TaxID=880057 RepID=A0A432W6K5_9GAMM|nr:MaoC/PaaZ C-terminal domain-containing protein [Aliidiomarina minuta]RUO25697.1 acyl dehydratase [Aliidiomarina minuta]
MQQPEDSMSNNPALLPQLPGMLVRAIPTVVRSGKAGGDLSEIRALYYIPALSKTELKAYHTQFPGLVSELPLTYFYLIAQRAHLAVMLSKEFPWPILGMVHVANKMEQLAPISISSPFTLEVRIEFPPRAATRKRVRPVYTVDFVQDNICVVRCESTYQAGTSGKVKETRKRSNEGLDLKNWQQLNIWDLDSGLGRSYARLSGDYNPIHLHPWLSRWFGFNQPIIHGMYSVAQAQADLEKYHVKPVRMMNIAFKRPLSLPNQVVSHIDVEQSKLMVTNADGSKAFLDGSYRIQHIV